MAKKDAQTIADNEDAEMVDPIRPVGRPQGSTIPVSDKRISLTVRVKPHVAANIKKLPKGHLRKHLENLYG